MNVHYRSGLPNYGCMASNSIKGGHERDSHGVCGLCGDAPSSTPAASTVYVCPERGIECGSNPARWCAACPQRKSTPAASGEAPQSGIDLDKLTLTKAQVDEIVYRCRQNGNDTTYDIVNAALALALARRAQPSVTAGDLPPLPEPKYAADDLTDIFTAEQVRQAQRDAVEAYKRKHAALQALVDQAQELDMGYGVADRQKPGTEEI